MSHDLSHSEWLERNLESARRRVKQLEIDACRIRTDLARLEVANAASDAAAEAASPRVNGLESSYDWRPVTEVVPEGTELAMGVLPEAIAPVEASPFEEELVGKTFLASDSWVADLVQRSRGIYRRLTSPVMSSLLAHAAIMITAVSITVATIEHDETYSPATTLLLGDKPTKDVETFEPHQLADLGATGVETVSVDLPQFEAVSPVSASPIPIEFESAIQPASPGELGLLDAHDTEDGIVPSGKGGLANEGEGTGLGEGKEGGKKGSVAKDSRTGGRSEQTMFFGTAAKGNRFVFVVDNSSSMKGGRLEMAVAELIRTVNGLSPRQSFYVIFVSDKTYPMFYPRHETDMVPATPENKKRLAEWAPKAMLAAGKNRELINAMELAASLQPQAVYLLWDGDLRYSETVRLDVLSHLTQPNQWNFMVHTLGMGITSANNEQNLRTIAQAHHGIYRRVDVPIVRGR